MASTDILLATFNGAPFLGDLLASLDAQTDQDWTLVVRDDGSADATRAILADWGVAHPGRLRSVEDGLGNLGAAGNFGVLLAASQADHFLLCDQDDVWLPDKVARLRTAIRAAEANYSPARPIIVHTDLIVADATLRPIAPSFWRYQRLIWPEAEAPWKTLALQNVVTGCAMIGNAALREVALPIPEEAMLHDWWLTLVAATMGRIIDDPEPSVFYRQHGDNSLGAKSWAMRNGLIRVLSSPAGAVRRANYILDGTRRQAQKLIARYGDRLEPRARAYLEEYAGLGRAGFVARKSFLFRHRLWFEDMTRNAGLLLCI